MFWKLPRANAPSTFAPQWYRQVAPGAEVSLEFDTSLANVLPTFGRCRPGSAKVRPLGPHVGSRINSARSRAAWYSTVRSTVRPPGRSPHCVQPSTVRASVGKLGSKRLGLLDRVRQASFATPRDTRRQTSKSARDGAPRQPALAQPVAIEELLRHGRALGHRCGRRGVSGLVAVGRGSVRGVLTQREKASNAAQRCAEMASSGRFRLTFCRLGPPLSRFRSESTSGQITEAKIGHS